MKPGVTTRPSASMERTAAPRSLPISVILPLRTPTSARNAAMPEPSITRPFLIKRSYVMFSPAIDWSALFEVDAGVLNHLPHTRIRCLHPHGELLRRAPDDVGADRGKLVDYNRLLHHAHALLVQSP